MKKSVIFSTQFISISALFLCGCTPLINQDNGFTLHGKNINQSEYFRQIGEH